MSNIILKELNKVTGSNYISIASGLQQLSISKATFYKKLSEGMSVEQIVKQFKNPVSSRKNWTNYEVKYLYENAGLFSAPQIARALSRTPVSVHKKCRTLGLSTNTNTTVKLNVEQILLCKILKENDVPIEDIHRTLFPYLAFEHFVSFFR